MSLKFLRRFDDFPGMYNVSSYIRLSILVLVFLISFEPSDSVLLLNKLLAGLLAVIVNWCAYRPLWTRKVSTTDLILFREGCWICTINLLVGLILAVDLKHYCFLVCDYLSADLISIISPFSLILLLAWFSIIYIGLGVSISPSFSLYSRFVNLFSHRASPYAKFCGFLPQDFISQC